MGEQLLKDLPYDEIYTTLDDYDIRSEFWAAGKVIALGEVPLDAILIDTDLFLYDGNLIDKIHDLDVVCSHRETAAAYSDLLQFGSTFIPWINKVSDWSQSSNTGIINSTESPLFVLIILNDIKILPYFNIRYKWPLLELD
jgi:hypothetical protein